MSIFQHPDETGLDRLVPALIPKCKKSCRSSLVFLTSHPPKQTFTERTMCSCRVPWIQRIVAVVAKENVDMMTDIVQHFQHRKVRVAPGGSTRHRSICNGVLALAEGEEEKPKVVIIHDAVRPFVEEDFLYKIAMAAKEQGVSMIKAVSAL